ncbi:MAG: amidohydrolase [Gammaproteobacteria bacterium]|nr:amidohydrolase [Gammaproteobacteria bacterium]
MLIDTHVHLIDRQRLTYPWIARVPALNQDATYTDYLRQCRQLGITHSLHMEVDVAESDIENETLYIKELMDRPDSQLVGAIASCRPEQDTFQAYFERQKLRPWIKGFRRILHEVDDELSRNPLFRSNLKLLSNTSFVFDVCARADQLPIAIELVDSCPDVQFVLDHCGVPNVKSAELDPWREQMSRIAERPNVAGKISGVIAYGNGLDWTLEDIRPFVEHTFEAFGPDRVVWGSDSPVCTLGGSLASWVAATRALFMEASASERAAFYYENARRIWSL